MKRIAILALAGALALTALAGCGGQPGESPAASTTAAAEAAQGENGSGDGSAATAESDSSAAQTAAPESSDPLVGSWATVAVIYDDEIKKFSEYPTLADLYDNVYVTFAADGRFAYKNGPYITRGSWSYYDELEGLATYVMRSESVSQVTAKTGLGGKEVNTQPDTVYQAALIDSDRTVLSIHKQNEDLDKPMPVFSKTDSFEVPLEPSEKADVASDGSKSTEPTAESPKSKSSSAASGASSPSSGAAAGTGGSSSGDDDFSIVDSGYDDAKGKGYKGSDGNYYFMNDDGSVEATDGFGNGVKDVDGDGEPDYYTTDGGKTWKSM